MNQVCIKRSFFKLIERIIYYLLLILALDRPLCDVGHSIQDHKRCEGEVISSETSHENSRELIILRTNLTVKESFNICDYHRNRFLDKYSFFEKYCCDLFNQHNKNCIYRLKVIEYDLAMEIGSKLQLKVGPGKKICGYCRASLNQRLESITPNSSQSVSVTSVSQTPSSAEYDMTSAVLSQGSEPDKFLSKKKL